LYENYLYFEKNIEGPLLLKNSKKPHKLILDNAEINSEKEFVELMENFYNSEIFDENTKIHLKLKINLYEFLIISHLVYPTFLKTEYK
jgi:hypothetical protein